MEKISVIIPVYNVERYLARCIESVLRQTHQNIEILLIDDGSTDGSGKVCDKYAKSFENITVLHQKNSGVSVSRNRALKLVSGEYIGFIDSDDTIKEDMYETLVSLARAHQADMVSCNIETILQNGQVVASLNDGSISKFFTNRKVMANFLGDNVGGISSCSRIYKAAAVKECMFPENIKNNEDKLFLYEVCKKSKRHVHVNLHKYSYCKRDNSASTSIFSKNYFDMQKVATLIEADVRINYASLLPYAQRSSITSLLHLMRMLILSDDFKKYKHEYLAVRTKLASYTVTKDFNLNLVRRIELFLFNYAPRLYIQLIKGHGAFMNIILYSKRQRNE